MAQKIHSLHGLIQVTALDTEALGSKAPSKIPDSRIWVRFKITFNNSIKVFV